MALNITGTPGNVGWPYDFGYRPASRYRCGFESQLGPGFEIEYFQYDHQSKLVSVTGGAMQSIASSVWMTGPSDWTRMQSTAPGQTFRAAHDLEVHSLGVSFFKDYRLPRARINGMLGGRYVSVAQHGDVRLFDGSGNPQDRLQHITDLRAIGPRAIVEYTRRIGHTRLEVVGSFGGSILVGNRDQYVQNTQTGQLSRTSANDLLSVWEMIGGVQYVMPRGENRSVYARVGASHQIWLGGGSASHFRDDFGFRGFVATIGVNR